MLFRSTRFSAIDRSAAFNFATVSWTERIKALPGWSGNLTLGTGPTGEQPARAIQNGFHHWIGNKSVPIGQTREAGDVMAGGSLTHWSKLFSPRETGFISVGVAGGSLYQEAYGRVGLRHVSLTDLVGWMFDSEPEFLKQASRFVRVSAMGRYGRIAGGAAFANDVVAAQSYVGQASISIADYGTDGNPPPRWALEFAATYDSGLFVSPNGQGIVRRFGSIALHFPYGRLEGWDDVLGRTDSGPTYGFALLMNASQMRAALAGY